MNAEQWARVERIFSEAVELPEDARGRFLDERCAGEAALRSEVASLLAADGSDTGPLAAGEVEAPPATIGPYRVVRALGRGGMGQVWLAERTAPGFQQQVAVKLLRRGLDTDDLLERFRRERQILARLTHPNIARLLDVGATEEGLPYFAMEYVDGVPILDHCDARALSIEDRLRLLVRICDAVQHAHGGLIVHRDIKPGNILVAEDGTPKLLDFGIAKVLGGDPGADGPAMTRAGLRLITPRYAAPEQIRGDPVTVACDVYALGLLAYEMVAGRHPFADQDTTPHDLERLTLDQAPPPPSAAVRGPPAVATGAARKLSAAQLRRRLEGDLDTVVLKALRKEPADRYPSVGSLSEDIERYLAGLPVRARPASAAYRLRKFVGRHRVGVAAAAIFVTGLSISTGVALLQSRQARLQAARVAQERDKAAEVQSFLLEMFGTTGPDQATGDSVTARQLLDRRAATVATTYADDPETRAQMLTVLAEGYERLGLYGAAEPLAREALELRRDLLGSQHADVAVSLNVVGWLRRQRGDRAEAERLLRSAVEVGRSVFPPEGDQRLARALNDLGVVRLEMGDLPAAEEVLTESLEIRRRLAGGDQIGVPVTLSNLGVVMTNQGRLEEAAERFDSARAGFERSVGPDHQRTLTTLFNLAALRSFQGDHAASAAAHRELLSRRERLLGPGHPDVAESMVSLANELRSVPALTEAEAVLDSALALQSSLLGPRHPELAHTLRVRGHVRADGGRHDDAQVDYARAVAILQSVAEPGPEVAIVWSLRAISAEAAGQHALAERARREAARVLAETYGASHPQVLIYRLDLVDYLIRRGDEGAARDLLDAVGEMLDPARSDLGRVHERAERARAALSATR